MGTRDGVVNGTEKGSKKAVCSSSPSRTIRERLRPPGSDEPARRSYVAENQPSRSRPMQRNRTRYGWVGNSSGVPVCRAPCDSLVNLMELVNRPRRHFLAPSRGGTWSRGTRATVWRRLTFRNVRSTPSLYNHHNGWFCGTSITTFGAVAAGYLWFFITPLSFRWRKSPKPRRFIGISTGLDVPTMFEGFVQVRGASFVRIQFYGTCRGMFICFLTRSRSPLTRLHFWVLFFYRTRPRTLCKTISEPGRAECHKR